MKVTTGLHNFPAPENINLYSDLLISTDIVNINSMSISINFALSRQAGNKLLA